MAVPNTVGNYLDSEVGTPGAMRVGQINNVFNFH
jgi:hypothetical protein